MPVSQPTRFTYHGNRRRLIRETMAIFKRLVADNTKYGTDALLQSSDIATHLDVLNSIMETNLAAPIFR